MSILAINGAIPGHDHGLTKASKIVYETLKELGMEVAEINLANLQIPYFSGMKSNIVEDIMERAEKAKGIIFLSSSYGFAPSALMQTFLEYFESTGSAVLYEKNCMVFAVVKSCGERAVADYFSRFLNYFGAYDSTKIVINAAALAGIISGLEGKDIIEKQTEDYYRMIRQNRKFFIPRDRIASGEQSLTETLTPEEAEMLAELEQKKKVPASEIYKKLDLDSFTKQQEADINDLTQYFAGKNTGTESHKRITEYEESLMPKTPVFNPQTNVTPRNKTCRQMTQSLPHYFQPQLAAGLKAVIQLMISGSEKFDGYLKIENNECEFFDGTDDSPDVTIVAEANIWMDVMKNKYTAQKAFMIGQLKVRGNFVILTKFDQIFKPL